MDPETYRKLEAISDVLYENVRGFPNGGARIATKLVKKVTGFEEVAGTVIFSGFKPFMHQWNHDPEGFYVDLTLHQYNDRLTNPLEGRIAVVPESYPGLRRTNDVSVIAQLTANREDIRELERKVKELLAKP